MRLLFALVLLSAPCLPAAFWKLPDAHIRYNHVSFLTSHNSYAAKRHGFFYAQQYWTIEEQLEHGVRGLMLDTYYNHNKTAIDLCHGGHIWNRLLRKGRAPMPLMQALTTIKNFLEKNPQEVLTIFLENYVDDKKLLDNAFRHAHLEPLILTPTSWDPQKKRCWPTLGWMQRNNKRLVIFNSIEKTDLTFNEWEHVVETQFGALVTKIAAQERKESGKWRHVDRYLYLVNYFSTFKISLGKAYSRINSQHLQQLMQEITRTNIRYPNFIALDYVNEGTAMQYINSINACAQDAFLRKTIFACLQANQ